MKSRTFAALAVFAGALSGAMPNDAALAEPVAAAVRKPTVDILVAYDKGAQAYIAAKGVTMKAFAEAQIVKMNAVLVTNRLDSCYSYRLAGVCKVDGVYNNIDTAPAQVMAGEGPAVSLRAARELCGADTVTLLVDVSGNTLGNSSPLSSKSNVESQHECAFSVCSIKAVDTGKQHTMIHENAHNMGCGHAQQSIINSPFSYGRGYYFKDDDIMRHTIMAYGGDNDASWYFSTSSSEFGFVLGDANNDNARVLRETCGAVSVWRESVRPFEDDVVATDASGREILTGRVFKNSIKVTLSKTGDGNATIVYTLDGSSPNSASSVYTAPLEISADTVLKVASVDGSGVSPVRTIRLCRIDAIPAVGIWHTGAMYPWKADNGAIRSCNHTNYSIYCTTPLSVTVKGPKRLFYKRKSYFLTPAVDSNYSHVEVLMDDVAVFSSNVYDFNWSDEECIDIPAGEHEVAFVYSQRKAMNNPGDYKDGKPLADDAFWIKDLRIEALPGASRFWLSIQ